MTITSVRGQTVIGPERTSTIQRIAAQAKQQFDATVAFSRKAPNGHELGASGSSLTTAISVSTQVTVSVSLSIGSSSMVSAAAGAKHNLFAALSKQQDDDDKLIGTLQAFLDGLKALNGRSFPSLVHAGNHAGHKALKDILSALEALG
jgi:cytoskeletal protein RodZ